MFSFFLPGGRCIHQPLCYYRHTRAVAQFDDWSIHTVVATITNNITIIVFCVHAHVMPDTVDRNLRSSSTSAMSAAETEGRLRSLRTRQSCGGKIRCGVCGSAYSYTREKMSFLVGDRSRKWRTYSSLDGTRLPLFFVMTFLCFFV